jgi:hypothetical protein
VEQGSDPVIDAQGRHIHNPQADRLKHAGPIIHPVVMVRHVDLLAWGGAEKQAPIEQVVEKGIRQELILDR